MCLFVFVFVCNSTNADHCIFLPEKYFFQPKQSLINDCYDVICNLYLVSSGMTQTKLVCQKRDVYRIYKSNYNKQNNFIFQENHSFTFLFVRLTVRTKVVNLNTELTVPCLRNTPYTQARFSRVFRLRPTAQFGGK